LINTTTPMIPDHGERASPAPLSAETQLEAMRRRLEVLRTQRNEATGRAATWKQLLHRAVDAEFRTGEPFFGVHTDAATLEALDFKVYASVRIGECLYDLQQAPKSKRKRELQGS
tara:strand:+ start:310 stop:654 length:345 start_codon:yes stop_codon:yes gene_type:complete